MVLALVCAMIPAAFAVTADVYTWDNSTMDTSNMKYLACLLNGGHTPSSYGYTTTCSICGAVGTLNGYNSGSYYGHNHVYTYYSADYHYVKCYSDPTCYYYTQRLEPHNGASCVYCNYSYGGGSSFAGNVVWTSSTCYGAYSHYPVYQYSDSYYDYYKCQYCNQTGKALKNSYATSNLVWYSGASSTCNHNPVQYSSDDTYVYYCCSSCGGYAYALKNASSTGSQLWSNGSYYCTGTYTPHNAVYNSSTGTYYCSNCNATAYGYGTGTGTGTGTSSSGYAYGANGKLYVTAYDSMTNGTYSLNESVYLSVNAASTDSTTYTYTYTWSGDVYATSSSAAYLNTSKSSATAYCTVSAYNGNELVDSATVYWTANALSGDTIYYSALAGASVALDEDDFKDFWAEQYPNGTLSYVRFTGVSTGNLYDNYNGAFTQRTDVRAQGSYCYLSPSYNQIGLDDLTYVPSAYGGTSAVTIQFTAYGTAGSSYGYGYGYGTSYGTTSMSGTISILYTAKEVTPIQYQATGSTITLKPDDFVAKYKEVMGLTTNVTASSLSIQFLEVPTYGSLYMNYNAGSYNYTTGTKLTSANIASYTFNGSTYASRGIDDVTYVPGAYSAVGESLKFACYYGNQLKFIGTVNFGSADPIAVEYATAGTTPVTFSSYDFTAAALASGYVYFGTPTTGTLYRNYANGTGTRVTNYDTFTTSTASYGSAYSLSSVTYVPASGYVGVVEIPIYSASTLLTTQKIGSVKVYVGRAFTDVLSTSSAWAAPYINKLSAQGIVNGTDTAMTKFSPTKTVTYGEALKLIMMAAGYPEQAMTGTHWASGYLTKAAADGLVASGIDLNAEVTRETIAAITAKALDLSYATSVNSGITKPSDTTNGYVYALYNAGILEGTNVGVVNYFYGSKSITRAEISKIVCLVAEYEK